MYVRSQPFRVGGRAVRPREARLGPPEEKVWHEESEGGADGKRQDTEWEDVDNEKAMLQRQDKYHDEVITVDEAVSDCSEDGMEVSVVLKRKPINKDNKSPPEVLEFEGRVIVLYCTYSTYVPYSLSPYPILNSDTASAFTSLSLFSL